MGNQCYSSNRSQFRNQIMERFGVFRLCFRRRRQPTRFGRTTPEVQVRSTVTITINDVAPGTFRIQPRKQHLHQQQYRVCSDGHQCRRLWANGSTWQVVGYRTDIYGTPTELWTHKSYMVWANNSGGSTVAYLNITVVDEVPTLSYSPSTLVLTINTLRPMGQHGWF